MSFVINKEHQISMSDSTTGLTAREMEFLEKSWAKSFADDLFPAIPEEKFSVLYSDKASRPNTPVNVIIGAMILKELFDLTDDEVLESILFDVRFQYALHTTSFPEQPISDRTLSRFRERCINYETETGADLVKDCIKGLAGNIAKIMGLHAGMKRMDSMMVASNIKKLSRLELIYTCVANLVNRLNKDGKTIPESMRHYCEENDRNKVIYHTRGEDVEERIKLILSDAAVLTANSAYDGEGDEYKMLLRVLGEQTIESESGSRILKEKNDPTLDSAILQSPADPDATYRYKSGKQHRGYAANLVEDVEGGKSVITDYDYQPNIKSDSGFLKDTVESLGKQEEPITIIADGAYGGEENVALAKAKNITLVATNMPGKKPSDVFADFEFSPDGKEILRCAGGQAPATNTYNGKTGQCYATFDRLICWACPFKEQCKPKFYKTKTSLLLSANSMQRAKQLRHMETEEFRDMAKIRNGVESLPSILRRKYNVDRMPVRGAPKMKLLFGFKVAAINFKKLLNHQADLLSCPKQLNFC